MVLGLQILISALAIGFAGIIGVRGFERSSDALDAISDGRKIGWLRLGGCVGLILTSGLLCAGVFAYWITGQQIGAATSPAL